jgi:hypothetical protein
MDNILIKELHNSKEKTMFTGSVKGLGGISGLIEPGPNLCQCISNVRRFIVDR